VRKAEFFLPELQLKQLQRRKKKEKKKKRKKEKQKRNTSSLANFGPFLDAMRHRARLIPRSKCVKLPIMVQCIFCLVSFFFCFSLLRPLLDAKLVFLQTNGDLLESK
jgi:hypothetical protein